MSSKNTESLLASVANGTMSVEDALLELKRAPFEDLGYAKVDHHRKVRQGAAEVIYGEGKTVEQIHGICSSLLATTDCVLITRLDRAKAAELQTILDLTYDQNARIGIVGTKPEPDGNGTIVVCAAGTSDLPIAEEAALTAEALGNQVTRLYDVGVAGLHRVLAHLEELSQAQVIVAVAGMEGALPSVIAGLVSAPVIAVPTSVGYGASLGGLAALLSMLNSCASGVSVVNIDNGFGAAFQAHQINHLHGAGVFEQVQEEPAAGDVAETVVPAAKESGLTAVDPHHIVTLDLSKDARRSSLLSQLEAQMDEDQLALRDQIVSSAHVPERHHHDIGEVNETIRSLSVPEEVKQHLRQVYDILAHAEAAVHQMPLAHTHFHEVGNGSAIANALAIVTSFYVFEPSIVKASPVQTGKGQVECAHGLMDIPAPATKAILDMGIPVVSQDQLVEGEFCTPTSAAIIKHFVNEFVKDTPENAAPAPAELKEPDTEDPTAPLEKPVNQADRTSVFPRINADGTVHKRKRPAAGPETPTRRLVPIHDEEVQLPSGNKTVAFGATGAAADPTLAMLPSDMERLHDMLSSMNKISGSKDE